MERGRFEEVSDRLGAETYRPWGPSTGDLNADGWDDIFIASGMSYPYRYGINSLLLNDHGRKFIDSEFVLGIEPRRNLYTRWFEIDCSDPNERRAQEELGSKVCVGQSGKSGYLAQRVLPLYFGLGDSAKSDSVEIDWPSSRKQTVSANLVANQTLHITEKKRAP